MTKQNVSVYLASEKLRNMKILLLDVQTFAACNHLLGKIRKRKTNIYLALSLILLTERIIDTPHCIMFS